MPTFAVDDGFSYSLPAGMDAQVGSIVRVPLGGRRVRGWITAMRSGDSSHLKEVIGVSGARPIFTADLLQTLRWAAVHYVSPLAALLPKAGPPNLPKVGRVKLDPPGARPPIPDAVSAVVEELVAERKVSATFAAGSGPWHEHVAAVAWGAAQADRSSLAVVPTAADCNALAERLERMFGNRVVAATSSAAAADRTRAWSQAAGSPGTIVVGTPEVVMWPIAELAVATVIEEGRRSMKSRQTPTVHVRELMRRRATVERFGVVFAGQVPTLEVAASGMKVKDGGGRVWPLVEIVDRTEEPPSSALLSAGVNAAIAGAIKRREPAFVFVSRRGYSPATRCVACGELRRCPNCGSNPGRGPACERCQAPAVPCTNCSGESFAPVGAAVGRVLEELKQAHGRAVSGPNQGGLVQVGTERDLPPPGSMALAAIVDADSMLLRPHYRAEDDTLRVMARVVSTVARGRGHRCVIQSRMADHRVVQAIRHGSSGEIVAEWLAEREAEQLPPFGQILALEIADPVADSDSELRSALGEDVAVFGPADAAGRSRWLLQAPDLRRAKIQLRERVQSWRDRGATVRVDADPIDV